MRPDLTRSAPRGTMFRAAFFLLVGGGAIGAILLVMIAAGVSGVARTVILAILTPTLVLSVLILWRSALAASRRATRRQRLIAELRERGVLGALALPRMEGEWAERLNRHLRLAAGPHLLAIDPESAGTAEGQQRLRIVYDLLGAPQPQGDILPPPARATLALIEPNGDVHIWDVSSLIERADAGDDAAREELLELELHVQQRAIDVIRG